MAAAAMSTAAELRLIADSLQVIMPFQSARLHVLASEVEDMAAGLTARRADATRAATDKKGGRD